MGLRATWQALLRLDLPVPLSPRTMTTRRVATQVNMCKLAERRRR
jgi:hypothetical protein